MKAVSERKILRYIHLIGAAVIGTYVYSPWSGLQWFAILTQMVIIPALALSGVWMWQGQKVRRWIDKKS